MAIKAIGDVLKSLKERLLPTRPAAPVDPTVMTWPRGDAGGELKIARCPWVLVDVEVTGLLGDLEGGMRYVDRIIQRATAELEGTGAALPSAAEPDGPGDWRAGLAAAVKANPPPNAVLLLETKDEPIWWCWIVKAILGELRGTNANVLVGTGSPVA